MRSNWINRFRIATLTGVLLCWCCISETQAGNYFRVSGSIAYAHDMRPGTTNVGMMPEGGWSLAQAQALTGSGIAEPLTASNGAAPAIGIGYRFTKGAFLLDAGLGLEYRYMVNRPQALNDVTADATDDTGLAYTAHHSWRNRQVHAQHVGLSVPLMFGGEWSQVYVMAGLKAHADLWGRSSERGEYSLTGDYERYMDPMANVPGHGFVQDEPYQTAGVTTAFGWELRACAEVGYCFNAAKGRNAYKTRNEPRYYLGAFAEYAFMGTAQRYLPVLAGVKMTVLLPLPESKKCNCLNY